MHKDGHWVWVLDRGKVTERNKEGKPVRMTGTHLDISERKAAEEALRQVNRKLNLISSLSRHDILNRVSVLLGYLDRAKTMTADTALLEHLDRLEVSTKTIGKLVQFTRDFKDLGMQPPQWFAVEDIIHGVSRNFDSEGIVFRFDVGPYGNLRRSPDYPGLYQHPREFPDPWKDRNGNFCTVHTKRAGTFPSHRR